jgi:hypothetical protein
MLAPPEGGTVYMLDDWNDRLYQARRTDAGVEFVRVYREFTDGARGLRDSKAVTLSPDGRNLYVTAGPGQDRDGAGTVSVFARDTATGDLRYVSIFRGPFFDGGRSAPPSLAINGGDDYTNDPRVELTIPASPLQFPFPISNDGGFDNAVNVQPSPDGRYRWRLDSSGPERLPKTVYARIWTADGSTIVSDEIVLDERPPALLQVDLASGPAREPRARFRARDDRSGVGAVQLTRNRSRGGRWRRFSSRRQYAVDVGVNWARVRDRAGNRSRWRRFVVGRSRG